MPISKLALQFSSQHPEIPTTLFSSARAESVQRNVRWHEETLDASLLAQVRKILAPVINQQWDYDAPLAESQKPTASALSKNDPQPAPIQSSANFPIPSPSPFQESPPFLDQP